MADIRALSRQAREAGGGVRFECRLHGDSMEPGIRPGDVLLVETASAEDLSVGEVIVYDGDHGRPVAHRLVRLADEGEKRRLIARSDVPGARDEVVRPDDLIGRVVKVRRVTPPGRALHRAVAALRRRVSRARRGGHPAC